MDDISRNGRVAAAIVATIGWSALLLQIPLTISDAARVGNPVWVSLINLFSYFTILTNTLVASAATMTAAGRAGGLATPGARAALVLYIIVVGLIYQTLLRGLVPMAGPRLLTDTIFHAVIPLIWPMWWAFFGRVGPVLSWAAAVRWLAFPLGYGLYSVVRGSVVGRWPYPFMDAGKIGYLQVAINLASMLALFFGFALLLVVSDRFLRRRPIPN